jgi:4-amino-4-deoxy-L-arabinose transferase-like glycosyltransferase
LKYIFLSLFTVLLFINNDSLALWEQDEAAYAGFAYNMLEKNDYLIPDFEWSWPHRKPPFHFWMIAASYSVFGYNEFATRLPSVLAILASLFLLYCFTKRLYSMRHANWASLVFMSSLLIPLYGKISMTDAGLLCCFIGTYFSVLTYLKTRNNLWLALLFFLVSIGGLTKGPPIYITSLGALGLAFVFGKERRLFFNSLVVVLLGIVPFVFWAYLTYQKDGGEFINWWLDWYILKRTSGTIYGQTGILGYYLLIFILCFFPWILFLPKTIKSLFSDFVHKNKLSHLLFQTGWLVFGWLFYELIKSKLPSYAFAVIPVWCIYIAQIVINYKDQIWSIPKIWTKFLGGIFILLGAGVLIFKNKVPFQNIELTSYSLAFFFIVFGFIYVIQSNIKSFQNRLPELAIAFAFCLNLMAWGIAIPAFEDTRRFPKSVSESLQALNYKPKYVFFSCDYSMSSLPVYLSWAGYKYHTADRIDYEKYTFDSLKYSKKNLFMLQRRNMHYLNDISDSFKITPLYGWISDRGKVDTFFIAERMGAKRP